MAKLVFWISLSIVFYSYVGYGLILWIMVKIRKKYFPRPAYKDPSFEPPVSLVVAAYNEQDFIEMKIKNTMELDYPPEKAQLLFVTDGSSDKTLEIISKNKRIQLLHKPERSGKVAAMHRAMAFVRNPIVIFCDANTLLNKECIREIVKHYADPTVGGVAGEKKILKSGYDHIAGAGEGLYWKYESFLKKLDAEWYTVVGAAGELFSVRTDLYENVGDNIILDDFVISLRVCLKGYRIEYEPAAYAAEAPSSSIADERKRKIRISAGAFQSMHLLKEILNIYKYPKLSFQYISHRVLRWTVCPPALVLIFVSGAYLAFMDPGWFYPMVFIGQVLFYISAIVNWALEKKGASLKLLYVPYYFVFMNVSLVLGFFRYIRGRQTVLWEKASRRN